ncbi:hypothetical protein TREAZ_1995 [Leadbettera azotonutricia ZAS-9]|uniref:Uncharacterized protein n=1 Tax=Leadbettera azotonutricia (strain ATCC BAA-888 / DSM 13862 / ZAS-9) TaxID=545695 RepID=F5YAL6_LEAAZ|nr:hypothetical protein TREAZ_1995 [Leadbettera azotonutricia ZAS-9]
MTARKTSRHTMVIMAFNSRNTLGIVMGIGFNATAFMLHLL